MTEEAFWDYFTGDMMTFQAFKEAIAPMQEVIWSEIYRNNPDLIGVAKEKTAVRNLKKIVDATLALSNEKGFHAMSLRDLVAKAEISKGGLYAYIKNKDDLALLIQKHGYSVAMRILQENIRDIDAPDERLLSLLRSYVYTTELMRPWFRFFYMEARSLGETGRHLVMESEFATDKLFADIIRDGQAQGLFRNMDPELSAAMIKALIQDHYLKQWKYRELQVDVEAYVAFLTDVVRKQLWLDGPGSP